MATNIDKDTQTDSISQLVTLQVLVNKKTPNGYDLLYLRNIDQREIKPSPEIKSDEVDDNSAQSTNLPCTPKETPQIPIQTETLLLQNVQQINKPSAQQETLGY